MKRIFGIIAALVLLSSLPALAEAPRTIGGFTIGAPIDECGDRVRSGTALPIRYMQYLTEVEIADIDGFKSGLIAYGACAEPGRIVRIKLKYKDGSQAFYNRLLARFKERFGEPDEWRGDPFHVVLAWKWSFVDKDGKRTSLILQHNHMDEDEKMGNSVKLTNTTAMDQELECHRKRHPEAPQMKRGARGDRKAGWDLFIPR